MLLSIIFKYVCVEWAGSYEIGMCAYVKAILIFLHLEFLIKSKGQKKVGDIDVSLKLKSQQP